MAREGLSPVDSILQHLTIKEKVELILVPLCSVRESDGIAGKRGFRAFIPDTVRAESPEARGSAWNLLDARDGFITRSLLPPFPDGRAIATLRQHADRELLARDLTGYLHANGFRGVLAPSGYLFEGQASEARHDVLSDRYPLSVWLPLATGLHAEELPVTYMPTQLFSRNRSHFLRSRLDPRAEHAIVWPVSPEMLKSEFSFQKRLEEGFLFLTRDYDRDMKRLVRAYELKWLHPGELDRQCRRIISAQNRRDTTAFSDSTNVQFIELIRRRALEGGIDLFQREQSVFPLTDLSQHKIAVVADLEVPYRREFTLTATRYHVLTNNPEEATLVFWLAAPGPLSYDAVAARVEDIRARFINARVVLFWAGHQRQLPMKKLPENLGALVAGSSNHALVWESMAQAAFSGLEVNYCLNSRQWPHSLAEWSRRLPRARLKYGVPLEVGLDPDSLLQIDELMREAISHKAMPGGRVLVARGGVVVWDRSYGHHTYQRRQPVRNGDLFDVASVTKVTATLPALMKLYEEQKWSLRDTLAKFFPEADTTDKRSIRIEELLRHQSGLPSFIPFYLNTIDREKVRGNLFSRRYSSLYSIKLDNRIYLNRTVAYRPDVFHTQPDSLFSVPVAHQWFLNRHYLDSIRTQVLAAPMRMHHDYLYSDLGFYFLGELIPRLTGKTLKQYAAQNFHDPLGADHTLFLPLTRFPAEKIVPTEQDNAFRRQLLRGWVHDPGAAMMGGVAGHAGLFSTAGDLAKIMQMYLNKGEYGGVRFLKPETIELFTRSSMDKNRRALGFDKPDMENPDQSPASRYASALSFGHSGFTGTLVWADPAVDLVYIFLSNRVHPHQYNKKLIKENIRTRVQDVVYRSLIVTEEEPGPVLQNLEGLNVDQIGTKPAIEELSPGVAEYPANIERPVTNP